MHIEGPDGDASGPFPLYPLFIRRKDIVRLRIGITSTVLALMAGASAAAAQTPAQAPAPAAEAALPAQASQPAASAPAPVTAGWRDGFYIQSEKGDFRLQIGALLHADGRFSLEDEAEAVNDTFLVRRLRPYVRGRFAQRFEFYLNPDFAGGTLLVQDAYIDTVFSPAFRIRAGKAKTPFGLERLQSASNLLFYERALPTALAPNRDVGIQVLGDLAGGTFSYQAAVLNGAPDGGSVDVDTSDSKDLAARVVVRPFARAAQSPLRALSLGAAASIGEQSGAGPLAALRTASVQQTFLTYSGAVADGRRLRYSPQLSYTFRQFGGLAEWVHSEMPVRRGGLSDDIAQDAWQVAVSWVLTGEAATDGSSGLRPRSNFDFGAGHYGAVQIAARYHVLEVDDSAATLGVLAPGASRHAEAWTAGLNWYLTPNVKYVLNFERTTFDRGAERARDPENALAFRTQVSF